MIDLGQVLARRGEGTLTNLLGSATVELLQALDLGSPSSTTLSRLVVRRFSEIGILLDKKVRLEVINGLRLEEAQNACMLLGLNTSSPWDELSKCNVTINGKGFEDWLEFFEIDPAAAEQEEPRKTIEAVTNCEPDYPLFDHQIVAAREIREKFQKNQSRLILHMPTGAGKTRTAMNIIAGLLRDELPFNSVIFWLAHSEELCEQAASEFESAWSKLGSRNFPVIRHFGQTRVPDLSEINSGFVVMSLSLAYQTSLRSTRSFFTLGQKTKLVVMDEAHQAIAETYQHVLDLLAPSKNVYLLGLTATPGRKYLTVDEDIKLADFFERQKVTLQVKGFTSPIDFLRAEGYLSTVITDPILYDDKKGSLTKTDIENLSKGLDLSERALMAISHDAQRNLLIIHRIMEEAEAGNKIIIFACNVEHSETLATILELKGITAVSVTGKTHPNLRRESLKKFKETNALNVLVSCDILTVGFDAPMANVAIIARPTQSLVLYSQMVGRVARGVRAGGTKTCKVITVVDQLYGFRDLGESFVFWDDIWD